jgi:hypothetical protein
VLPAAKIRQFSEISHMALSFFHFGPKKMCALAAGSGRRLSGRPTGLLDEKQLLFT